MENYKSKQQLVISYAGLKTWQLSQILHSTTDDIKQWRQSPPLFRCYKAHLCSLSGEVIFWKQDEPHTLWGLCWSIYTLISLWVCCADKSQKGASRGELLPQQLPEPVINGVTVCTSRFHISASLSQTFVCFTPLINPPGRNSDGLVSR